MKKMYNKKEEGVSPVIATILMVAITVVLAATVWLMVSGYMGGTTNTPLTMSLTYNAQQSNSTIAVFDVTLSQPSQVNPTNVKITIKNGTGVTGSGTLQSNTTGYSATITLGTGSNKIGYTVKMVDLNGNGKLDTGDQIVIDGGSNSVSGLTIYIYVTGYSGNAQATVPS